jgi:hypothetical protein
MSIIILAVSVYPTGSSRPNSFSLESQPCLTEFDGPRLSAGRQDSWAELLSIGVRSADSTMLQEVGDVLSFSAAVLLFPLPSLSVGPSHSLLVAL